MSDTQKEIKQPVVTTRRGDLGLTDLFLGKSQVGKHTKQIEVIGLLDSLCSTIGLLKAKTDDNNLKDVLDSVQKDIRYALPFFGIPNNVQSLRKLIEFQTKHGVDYSAENIRSMIKRIEDVCDIIKSTHTELGLEIYAGWVDYGNSCEVSAFLHHVKNEVRAAERALWQLQYDTSSINDSYHTPFFVSDLLVEEYFFAFAQLFNRYSDMFFLLGLAYANFSDALDVQKLLIRIKHVE